MPVEKSSPSVDSSDSQRRACTWLLCAAVLFTCGAVMAMHEADPDLWGHAQYGRELLRTGMLPDTATWTYTAVGFPWINHENIAEIVTASVLDTFGPFGLSLGKYLLSVLVIGLIWRHGRKQGAPAGWMAALCITVALATEFHWHFRPQVLGYFFFTASLLILEFSFTDWREVLAGRSSGARLKHLFWLVPVMVIWTNTHGSFLAGICVIGAMCGLRTLELLWARRNLRRSGVEAVASVKGPILLLCAATVSVVLSTVVTPYGDRLNWWLWETIFLPTMEIGDWERLPLFSATRESLCFWVMVLTGAGVVWQTRNRDWVKIVLFLLIAWQAASHIRHLPMVALAWGIWMSEPIAQLCQVWREHMTRQHETAAVPATRSALGHGLAVCGLLVWVSIASCASWDRIARLDVPRSVYPVDAFEFLVQHRLEGRTIVTFNWAQYAIGLFDHAGMESTVAVDGRYRTCYPQEVLDRYFDFALGDLETSPRYRSPNSGPVDPDLLVTQDAPELVVISRRQLPSVRVMESRSDEWALLYQDGLAQIWGRRDLYDDAESPRYLAEGMRRLSDEMPRGKTRYPAFPSKDSSHEDSALASTAR